MLEALVVGEGLGDVTEVTALREAVSERFRFGRIVGRSRPMQKLFQLVEDVAASEASVAYKNPPTVGAQAAAGESHVLTVSEKKLTPESAVNPGRR